eukprot:371465-Rhodomonas_salina.1
MTARRHFNILAIEPGFDSGDRDWLGPTTDPSLSNAQARSEAASRLRPGRVPQLEKLSAGAAVKWGEERGKGAEVRRRRIVPGSLDEAQSGPGSGKVRRRRRRRKCAERGERRQTEADVVHERRERKESERNAGREGGRGLRTQVFHRTPSVFETDAMRCMFEREPAAMCGAAASELSQCLRRCSQVALRQAALKWGA